jgi:hypothetical protein
VNGTRCGSAQQRSHAGDDVDLDGVFVSLDLDADVAYVAYDGDSGIAWGELPRAAGEFLATLGARTHVNRTRPAFR